LRGDAKRFSGIVPPDEKNVAPLLDECFRKAPRDPLDAGVRFEINGEIDVIKYWFFF
jgi:hypothetical protein